jgi:hypothetical protein
MNLFHNKHIFLILLSVNFHNISIYLSVSDGNILVFLVKVRSNFRRNTHWGGDFFGTNTTVERYRTFSDTSFWNLGYFFVVDNTIVYVIFTTLYAFESHIYLEVHNTEGTRWPKNSRWLLCLTDYRDNQPESVGYHLGVALCRRSSTLLSSTMLMSL